MTQEFLAGFGRLISYFICCVICVLLIRRSTKVPTEIFRKMLHLVLLFSLLVFLYAFKTWWVSAISAVVFAVAVYPILALGEKIKGYSELLTERKHGEIKISLLIVFGMFAAIISVFWGFFGDRWLVLTCIFAWGFGDAAAALLGKRFGRRFLEGRFIEGRKSVEGTLSMFVVSFLTVTVVLLLRGGMPWYGCIVTAFVTAAACAVTELYTLGGFDTITCPFAAAAMIIPCVILWGGVSL